MMATGWDSRRVSLVLENISSKMFADQWRVPMFEKLYGISQGSIFNSGNGGADLLRNLFDSESIQSIETWIGSYNKDLKKFSITTNMSEDRCVMKVDPIDYSLYNLCPLRYSAGDVGKIAHSIQASCSIVPPEDHGHVDGGVVCASPVSYFKHRIRDVCREIRQDIPQGN